MPWRAAGLALAAPVPQPSPALLPSIFIAPRGSGDEPPNPSPSAGKSHGKSREFAPHPRHQPGPETSAGESSEPPDPAAPGAQSCTQAPNLGPCSLGDTPAPRPQALGLLIFTHFLSKPGQEKSHLRGRFEPGRFSHAESPEIPHRAKGREGGKGQENPTWEGGLNLLPPACTPKHTGTPQNSSQCQNQGPAQVGGSSWKARVRKGGKKQENPPGREVRTWEVSARREPQNSSQSQSPGRGGREGKTLPSSAAPSGRGKGHPKSQTGDPQLAETEPRLPRAGQAGGR